ncbi:MAG: site-2 protease family protein [Actinomycetes bacterium]
MSARRRPAAAPRDLALRVRLVGVDVALRPSAGVTLLVLWLLIFTDLSSTRLSGAQMVGVATAGAIAYLTSIVGHELAHAVTALRLGLPVTDVAVFHLGGVTRLGHEPEDPDTELAVALAGPLVNLAAGGVLLALSGPVPGLAGFVLGFAGELNAFVGVFNLIPAAPLDGGAIVRATVTRFTGDRARGIRAAARAGQVLGGSLLAVAAATWVLGGPGVMALWLGAVGAFVLVAARRGVLQADVRGRLEGVRLRDVARPLAFTAGPDWTVGQVVGKVLGRDAHGLVREGDRVLGVFGPVELAPVPRAEWDRRTVGELVARVAGTAPADAPLYPWVARVLEVGALHVDDGASGGVVTVEDILAFLNDEAVGPSAGVADPASPRPDRPEVAA